MVSSTTIVDAIVRKLPFCHSIRVAALLLIVVVAGTCASHAATFKILSDDLINGNECHLSVEGAIEPTDNDRLKTALGDLYGGKGSPIIACLDSAGGNFSEAIEIAKTFIDRMVKTRILPNKSCLSACAIVFMSGMTYSTGGGEFARSMHVTSRLGFHAPIPELVAGKNFDGDDLQAAYAAAIEAVGRQLLSLARHRGRASSTTLMKPTLLNEMMIAHGKDFFYIDTIRKAAEFGIELDGVPELTSFQIDDAMDACENAIAYAADSSLADLFGGRLEKIEKKVEPNRTEYNITTHSGHGTYCNVARWRNEWNNHVRLNIKVNTGSDDNNVYLAEIFMLPGETPLKLLAVPGYKWTMAIMPAWCSKPARPSEVTICNSRNLLRLDAHIERTYRDKMLTAPIDKKSEWKLSQRSWLTVRDDCRDDYACLYSSYHSRLGELNGEYSVDWQHFR